MSHKNWRRDIRLEPRIRKRGFKGVRSSWKFWKLKRNRRYRAREHSVIARMLNEASWDQEFPIYKNGVAWDAS